MKKICLIFGGILAIAGNAYAVTSTVTSKDYVDTEVGKKQNTIPVSGTNASTPGTTVVTYTNTAGTIGERGICDARAEVNGDCDGDNLVTRDMLSDQIQQATNLPTITTSKMTCVDSPDCTLWSVADQTVYGVCKGYGEYVSVSGDASECCSGFLNGVNRCGCKNNSDCPDGIECVQSGTYRYCNTGGGGK